MKTTLTVLCALALVVSGCSVTGKTNGLNGKCTSNSDCDLKLVCSNDVCVSPDVLGGSTDGGSDGTATAGAASSGTGSSSGTASSGTGSTSSAGSGSSSSAGSSSSSGSSSGSTGTIPPQTTTLVRAVNATPGATGVDICTKTATSAYKVALTNVLYAGTSGLASNFVEVDTNVTSIRVSATGTSCAAALATAADLDLTSSALVAADYTVVVTPTALVLDKADAANASSVVLDIVNASDATGDLKSDPLTGSATLATLAANGVAKSSVSMKYAGLSLEVTGASLFAPNVVATPVALGGRATIVVLGSTTGTQDAAHGAQVLVCDHSAAATASTCKVTLLGTTALSYVRFANMTAGQAFSAVCLKETGAATFAAAATINAVAADSVSGYVAVTATAKTLKAVGTGTNCSAGVSVADGTIALSAPANVGSLVTYVLGSGTSPSFNTDTYTVDLTATVAGVTAVTVVNTNGVAANDDFTVPQLYGAPLAFNLAKDHDTLVAIPNTTLTSAVAQTLRVSTPNAEQTIHNDFTIQLPTTVDASLSVFYAGADAATAHLVVCDDVTTDATGNSLCVALAKVAVPAAAVGYVRFANTTSAAVTVCTSGSGGLAATVVAANTTSIFTAFTPDVSGSVDLKFGTDATSCGNATSASPPHRVSVAWDTTSTTDVKFTTAVISRVGPTTESAIFAAAASSVDYINTSPTTKYDAIFLNAWTADDFSVLLGAHTVGSFSGANTTNTDNHSQPLDATATETFSEVNASNLRPSGVYGSPTHVPGGGSFFFGAAFGPTTSAPNLLWCDNSQLVGGNSACEVLVPTL